MSSTDRDRSFVHSLQFLFRNFRLASALHCIIARLVPSLGAPVTLISAANTLFICTDLFGSFSLAGHKNDAWFLINDSNYWQSFLCVALLLSIYGPPPPHPSTAGTGITFVFIFDNNKWMLVCVKRADRVCLMAVDGGFGTCTLHTLTTIAHT